MTRWDAVFCILTLAFASWEALVTQNYARAAWFMCCSIWFKIPFKRKDDA